MKNKPKKMDPFDPAINYGPNDAGISAFTYILIVVGFIAGSWAVASVYGLISDLLNKDKNNKE